MDRLLQDLCGKLRDETISEEEFASLEALLKDDPASREYYLRFMQLDSILEKYPPTGDDGELEEALDEHKMIRLPLAATGIWLAAAAAVFLLLVFVPGMLRDGANSNPGAVASRSIGTLILAEDCRWKGSRLFEGQRLLASRLDLEKGTAVIRFDGGAEAVLSGNAAFEMISPVEATLIKGEVVVRATEGAEGFVVNTPSGKLIDLGTEFAVKVEDSGATELHVHEGEVAVEDKREGKSDEVIHEGNAVRLDQKSAASLAERRPVDLDAPRFQELVARAQPKERRDLMTAYEGFHVEPGTYTPEQLKAGKGWVAPWRQRTAAEMQDHLVSVSNDMKIAHSRMEISWPLKGGQLGMLELPQGPNVWIREMKKPIPMNKYGVRYLSFLVTEPVGAPKKRSDGKLGRQDIRITLRSSADYFGESLSFGWERTQRPRISTDHGNTVRSIRSVPDGNTVFCVAKILTRKNAPDEVNFRFYTRDDLLDIVEPAEWDVALTGSRQNAEYDLLLLTSNASKRRYVDEIRVGPSWRSVTPITQPANLLSSSPTE